MTNPSTARKFRGIPVAQLGAAMARNVGTAGAGVETLEWDAIVAESGGL